MPTYGYHCPRCETDFEVFQRMTDDLAADCPTCGTPGRRLFFPAGIVFKGSGFYKTDSRRSGSGSAAGTGSGAGSGAASGGTPAPAAPAADGAAAKGSTRSTGSGAASAAPAGA